MKNFVLGLGAGTLIMGFFLWIQGAAHSSPSVQTQPLSQEPARTVESPAPKAVPQKEVPRAFKIVGKKVETKTKPLRPVLTQNNKKRKKPKAPRKLKLKVSGLLLSHLEDQRDELIEQVAAQRGDLGWRIRFKTPTSLISSLGLKDGDLIHYSSLEDDGLNETQYETMERLKALLRYLED